MEIKREDIEWFSKVLKSVLSILRKLEPSLDSIVICEVEDKVLVIIKTLEGTQKIGIEMNNSTFKKVYCCNELNGYSDEICASVRAFCRNLSKFNTRLRQVIIIGQGEIYKGEINRSVDKIGESVAMLYCR